MHLFTNKSQKEARAQEQAEAELEYADMISKATDLQLVATAVVDTQVRWVNGRIRDEMYRRGLILKDEP